MPAMKLAALLLVVAACGPKSTAPAGAETTTTSSPSSPSTTATTSNPTSTPESKAALSTWQQGAATAKSSYSCFSYVSGDNKKHSACMRTDDCGPYLEQTKSVKGIRDVSGCASVATVYCFHQPPSKDDPDGLEVCQPTLDECKVARTDVVKAKMSVDSDCAQR
jgi:hypothetical protein